MARVECPLHLRRDDPPLVALRQAASSYAPAACARRSTVARSVVTKWRMTASPWAEARDRRAESKTWICTASKPTGSHSYRAGEVGSPNNDAAAWLADGSARGQDRSHVGCANFHYT